MMRQFFGFYSAKRHSSITDRINTTAHPLLQQSLRMATRVLIFFFFAVFSFFKFFWFFFVVFYFRFFTGQFFPSTARLCDSLWDESGFVWHSRQQSDGLHLRPGQIEAVHAERPRFCWSRLRARQRSCTGELSFPIDSFLPAFEPSYEGYLGCDRHTMPPKRPWKAASTLICPIFLCRSRSSLSQIQAMPQSAQEILLAMVRQFPSQQSTVRKNFLDKAPKSWHQQLCKWCVRNL